MSRRDTILVAVLINAGLLALLFMIAINPDDDRGYEKAPLIVEAAEIQEKSELEAPVTVAKEVEIEKQEIAEPTQPIQAEVKKLEEKQHITITVKRGDMLERIARANGTTVQRLKALNQLQDERIEIGQLLRVPVTSHREEEVLKKAMVDENEEFYTIKSGDNPWKIAKQFNVRFDDLLQLNQLDEDKARKLKAGDKIRVH